MNIIILLDSPTISQAKANDPFASSTGALLRRLIQSCPPGPTPTILYLFPTPRTASPFLTKTAAGKLPHSTHFQNAYTTAPVEAAVKALHEKLASLPPSIIITMGDYALWSLTSFTSSSKYRGSFLTPYAAPSPSRLIPTYSLSNLQKMFSWFPVALSDFRKAWNQSLSLSPEPIWDFLIAPSYTEALSAILSLRTKLDTSLSPLPIAIDIETRGKQIACIGFASSPTSAFCIPLMSATSPSGYWTEEEEEQIILALRQVLSHPSLHIIGQNFLYDAQYILAQFLLFLPPHDDTMIAQGVLFPGTEKNLAFLASMYCDFYTYWKDDGRKWEPSMGEKQLWQYNCLDCCRTWEIMEKIRPFLSRANLTEQYQFVLDMCRPILTTTARGVLINTKKRDAFASSLLIQMEEIAARLSTFFPPLSPPPKNASPRYNSPIQLARILYDELGLEPVRKKKPPFSRTTDDPALQIISKREPLLSPILSLLAEYRSVGVFFSTFIQAKLGPASRIHCSYNPVGTETLRLNSYSDSFDEGTNLQNIPT